MNPWLIQFFAGGLAFFPGLASIALAVLIRVRRNSKWPTRLSIFLTIIGVMLVVLSAEALPCGLYTLWAAVIATWFFHLACTPTIVAVRQSGSLRHNSRGRRRGVAVPVSATPEKQGNIPHLRYWRLNQRRADLRRRRQLARAAPVAAPLGPHQPLARREHRFAGSEPTGDSPHITNQIIRQALHPYPKDLVIVTKLGVKRPADKSWRPAISPDDLTAGVHDNLKNLGLDALDIVNYRAMGAIHGPAEGSVEPQITVLADLQRKGLIRHIGISNATAKQVAEAQKIVPIVCVQNNYNLAHREDDALIGELAGKHIPYVPFFPLGGFTPLQSSVLSDVAIQLGATPMQTALAWLLQWSPNVLLIPGTSSLGHLTENLAAASLALPADAVKQLDGIAEARH